MYKLAPKNVISVELLGKIFCFLPELTFSKTKNVLDISYSDNHCMIGIHDPYLLSSLSVYMSSIGFLVDNGALTANSSNHNASKILLL